MSAETEKKLEELRRKLGVLDKVIENHALQTDVSPQILLEREKAADDISRLESELNEPLTKRNASGAEMSRNPHASEYDKVRLSKEAEIRVPESQRNNIEVPGAIKDLMVILLSFCLVLLIVYTVVGKLYFPNLVSIEIYTITICIPFLIVFFGWTRFHSITQTLALWRPHIILIVLVFSFVMFGMSLATLQNINRISDAYSTRFAGTFPQNLTFINGLLDDVRDGEEVAILTDHAAYGAFSNPVQHEEYVRLLTNKRSAKITIRTMSPTALAEAAPDQFKSHFVDASSLAEFCDSEKMKQFVARNEANGFAVPRSMEELIAIIKKKDTQVQEDFANAGLQHKYIEVPPPVFIWLVGRRRAAFSFYNGGVQSREVTFVTSDPNMIGILVDIFSKFK